MVSKHVLVLMVRMQVSLMVLFSSMVCYFYLNSPFPTSDSFYSMDKIILLDLLLIFMWVNLSM